MKPGTLFEKQYFRRTIEGYLSPYLDPFEYHMVPEVGEHVVCLLMLPFVDDKTNPDQAAQARIEWEGLKQSVQEGYLLNRWLVAYENDVPIGIVFPMQYNDQPEEGSIAMVGVFPQYQGKGYGKILHAKGLEVLAKMGVTKYVGSTEVSNAAMLAVAKANGCTMTKIYKIQVDEMGRHIPVKEQ